VTPHEPQLWTFHQVGGGGSTGSRAVRATSQRPASLRRLTTAVWTVAMICADMNAITGPRSLARAGQARIWPSEAGLCARARPAAAHGPGPPSGSLPRVGDRPRLGSLFEPDEAVLPSGAPLLTGAGSLGLAAPAA